MSYNVVTILFALSLISSGRILGQANWSRYKPGSICALIAQERDGIQASIRAGHVPLTVTSANSFPTLAVAEYQDSTRPTSPAHLQVLTVWAKTQQRRLDVGALFPFEVLFREDTLSLWVPVQAVLIPALKQELQRGDRVAVYVGYIGAQADDSTAIDWVFIINEFQKR